MNGYRKELKYIVSDTLLADVENRISAIMHKDIHQDGDFYLIKSIYLDTPSLKCLRENESGISTREKFRLRSYNCNDSVINAEIKIRHRETISKMSADISRDTLDAIVSGDVITATNMILQDKRRFLDDSDIKGHYTKEKADIIKKTYDKYVYAVSAQRYMPAVTVSYERCAYVYDLCNVRITFDRNVTASKDFGKFFDEGCIGRPAIEEGKHVLEIKYDEFLPDEIASVLSGVQLERTSCSKYARCMYSFGH